MPPKGSPQLPSGGQNQRCPTSGQGGYITPAALGVPTTSERGAESEVAQRWAHCLRACIFSKIGNSFFVVRSCIFYVFVVNACRKKTSHLVILVAVSPVIYFFAVNADNKRIVTPCNFFLP